MAVVLKPRGLEHCKLLPALRDTGTLWDLGRWQTASGGKPDSHTEQLRDLGK